MGTALLIILITLAIIELIFKPRFDITDNENLILWYGRWPKRKRIVFF